MGIGKARVRLPRPEGGRPASQTVALGPWRTAGRSAARLVQPERSRGGCRWSRPLGGARVAEVHQGLELAGKQWL